MKQVATAPTVYGIETISLVGSIWRTVLLQQHLPFTVLKQNSLTSFRTNKHVATAPTVYGIETLSHFAI